MTLKRVRKLQPVLAVLDPIFDTVVNLLRLPKEEDPYTVTFERALELVAEKKKADAEKQIKIFVEQGISILNGRYGPYITDGTKNAKVPKDREPASLELEECITLLAAAPVSRGRGRKKKAAAKKKVSKKAAEEKD